MKVIAAFPDKEYLDSLSPVLYAFGEPVIKPSFGANGASLSPLGLVESFQTAASKCSGSAIIATSHTPAWSALHELLRDPVQHRALIFFESSSTSIAHSLAAKQSSYQAKEEWLSYARGLLELVKSHSGSITLIDVHSAYSSTRSLMGVCADRFPFQTIDRTVEVKKPTQPDPAFLLMARELVRQSQELQKLERRLNEFAVFLEGDRPKKLDVDYLSADRHALLEARTAGRRAENALAEQRQTKHAAEQRAEDLSRKLEACHMLLQQLAPFSLKKHIGQESDEKVATFAKELRQMRFVWKDVQAIAEQATLDALKHQADASEAREELVRLREELVEMRAGRTEAGAQATRTNAAPETVVPLSSQSRGRVASVKRLLSPGLFRHRSHRVMILKSGYFNADWYRKKYPDVAELGVDPLDHFIIHGGLEGRAPGPRFSSFRYLKDYPDVAQERINPLLHYLLRGQKECRKAYASE